MSARYIAIRRARPQDFDLGLQVALAAKRATGVPFDVDEEELARALTARQHAAAAVWLAADETGQVIGHALAALVSDDHYTWGPVTDLAVAAARRAGTLVELGGLSVHPDHHRRGVGRLLQRTRIGWARAHGYLPVAAAWDDSAGSSKLCRQHGTAVGTHPDFAITLFRLDHAA